VGARNVSRVVLVFKFDVLTRLDKILTILGEIKMSQADINADVQALTGVVNDVLADASTLLTDVTAIQQEIAAGGTVSTTALDALTASAAAMQSTIDSATSTVSGLVTPPASS
jgi:hypothetical protein